MSSTKKFGGSCRLPYHLTVPEVADLIRTSRSQVYNMISSGLLPGVVRIGRRVLVCRDDLLVWLDGKRAVLSGDIDNGR